MSLGKPRQVLEVEPDEQTSCVARINHAGWFQPTRPRAVVDSLCFRANLDSP
jgi:hypothetical protein